MDKPLLKKISKVVIQNLISIIICLILYYTVLSESSTGKHLIVIFTYLFILFTLSSYPKDKNNKYKIFTFFLILSLSSIYFILYYIFIYIIGLNISNPVFILNNLCLTILSIIILSARYTKLNFLKTFSLFIGLCFIGFVIIIIILNIYLNKCADIHISGYEDPWWLVSLVYLSIFCIFGLSFYLEMTKKIKSYKVLILLTSICIFISILTWNKCKYADGDKNKEPSWIDIVSSMTQAMAWFNVFIGHFKSSTLLAFISFYIIRTCSYSNTDPRLLSLSVIFLINLVKFVYNFVKHLRKK